MCDNDGHMVDIPITKNTSEKLDRLKEEFGIEDEDELVQKLLEDEKTSSISISEKTSEKLDRLKDGYGIEDEEELILKLLEPHLPVTGI